MNDDEFGWATVRGVAACPMQFRIGIRERGRPSEDLDMKIATLGTLSDAQQTRRRNGKGVPRILMKLEKRRARAVDERSCRLAVDRRDHRRCFFPTCKVYAGEKHHIRSSSTRGVRIWITSDILSSCGDHHRWFKAGLIRVVGNPDHGPVTVHLTTLGQKAKLRIPARPAA